MQKLQQNKQCLELYTMIMLLIPYLYQEHITYSPIFSKDPFLLMYSVIAPLNIVAYLCI